MDALPPLLARQVQLIILGNGDELYHRLLTEMAGRYPDRMRVLLRYDETLARKIYAGSDLFLMPSRYEPCGLGQMHALRYGAVPVVRRAGGLADTVISYSPDRTGNRVRVQCVYDGDALASCVRRALTVYQDPKQWKLIVQAGMKHFTQSAVDTTYTDDGSSNGVVVNPTSANAFILGLGGEIVLPWSTGSLSAATMFRFNLTDSARYVAQFANTLGLNEDIYNDFFSYECPEVQLTLKQTLPLGITLSLSGEYAVRKYFAPAFDLVGNEVEPNRVDHRFAAEFYASRYVEIGGKIGIDDVVEGADPPERVPQPLSPQHRCGRPDRSDRTASPGRRCARG